MAESEAAVGTESVACEGKEVSLPVTETEPGPERPERLERPEEVTPEATFEEAETQDAPDNKRKLEDLEPLENDEASAKKQEICVSEPTSEGLFPTADQLTMASEEAAREIGAQETDDSGHPSTEKPVMVVDGTALESALESTAVDGNVDEHSRQDGETEGAGLEQVKMEKDSLGNGHTSSTDNIHYASADDTQYPSLTLQQDGLTHARQQTPYDLSSSSQKIEIPNNKVGILIGKSGGTIRYLQLNSGAKIQITRDADVGPHSSTRPVELTGTPENINKAEQLIKNVIAEADAGGSPSLVARGFITSQSGSEQIEMQIPNDKVGMVIGKGGETIKNLQSKTGARIQLIPQHLPEGDASKERTVRITGNKKQVESAKEMIKDVMNQVPIRPSSLSNTFRPPRGPAPVTQWGPRAAAPNQQTMDYDHQQRGMYPPQTTQYPRPYGGYSQQHLPRGMYGSSWDQQRPAVTTMQTGPQPGGYDYYNQGGLVPTNQPSNQLAGPVPASTPAPMNYNYAQSQASDGYGTHYVQPPPAQQKYGHGYNEPKYDGQPPDQQMYGQQQPVGSQPGMYGQQSSTPYGTSQSVQPGELMYQGAPPNQYPSSAPMQQPYPYASSAPTQQAPPYGQAYGPTPAPADGFSQQTSGGYPQQPAQVYGQGGQAVPAYGQTVPQSGGYSQYPSSQPTYDQTAAQAYQGAAPDAAYAGNVPNSGYASQQPAVNQPSDSQPAAANPSGYYDQSMPPQSGYAMSGSPQPGYGGQYDSAQTYGHR